MLYDLIQLQLKRREWSDVLTAPVGQWLTSFRAGRLQHALQRNRRFSETLSSVVRRVLLVLSGWRWL